MISKFLGYLEHHDPLRAYLRHQIIPQLGLEPGRAEFRVFQSACSRDVFLYEENIIFCFFLKHFIGMI